MLQCGWRRVNGSHKNIAGGDLDKAVCATPSKHKEIRNFRDCSLITESFIPQRVLSLGQVCHYPARFKTTDGRAFRIGSRQSRGKLQIARENGRDLRWKM